MKAKLRTIIVDDEQSARENLAYLTKKYCETIEIVGEANNVTIAVDKIKSLKPDLVFLDIEMPQQNGFELFRYFKELSFHVVFVTAYNHYAVKAFEVSAVDYLLKPIDIDRLKQAEQKVLVQKRLNQNLAVLKENLQTQEIKNIAIPYKNDFIIIKIDNIVCIQANRAYSNITVYEKEKVIERSYTYAKKLAYFEKQLPQDRFIRVHRSWVINLNFVASYSKKESVITLEDHQKIPVSKTYKEAFEELFL